jgi:hypothetical protein
MSFTRRTWEVRELWKKHQRCKKRRTKEVIQPSCQTSQVEKVLPSEVQYACLYWVQHLQRSSSQVHDGEEAHLFLQAHLLHWLEALGWIGKTSEGIQAILSSEAHVPVSYLSIVYRSLINLTLS